MTFLVLIIVPIQFASGLSVTKYGSSAMRTTTESARNINIWVFFLFVPVYGRIIEKFRLLQFFGFLISIAGVLVYNEILHIPLCGFDKYTKRGFNEQRKIDLKIKE